MFKKNIFFLVLNILNILPPFGNALKIRGRWASLFLKKTGKNSKISSFANIYNPQNVSIKDNVYIGYSCYLGGGEIYLDDEVVIGPFCALAAGNHTFENDSYRFGKYDYGEISIGRGSWLGANCVITNNVKIGKGCLIAAGSVVTKDVEDFTMVAGVPAKPVKKLKK